MYYNDETLMCFLLFPYLMIFTTSGNLDEIYDSLGFKTETGNTHRNVDSCSQCIMRSGIGKTATSRPMFKIVLHIASLFQ